MGVLILLFQGGSLGLRTRRAAMVLVVIAILAGDAEGSRFQRRIPRRMREACEIMPLLR